MKNKIEYFLFISLSRFIGIFPLKFARKFAYIIGFVFYYFVPIRKEVARKNIKLAFPEKSDSEIRKILKKSYINFSIVFIEILYMYKFDFNKLKDVIKIEDYDLQDIVSQGNGLILLSAHFGNWEMLAASSAAKFGYPYSIVVKDVRNSLVDRFMNDLRCKWGNKIIKPGAALREIIKEIRDKKIVALLADQRATMEAPKMKFFGKETSVYTGPAYLAVRLKTPILCYLGYRNDDGTYSIRSHKIKVDDNLSDEEKVIQITKRYFEILETEIRKYPDHWLWFHDRWKY